MGFIEDHISVQALIVEIASVHAVPLLLSWDDVIEKNEARGILEEVQALVSVSDLGKSIDFHRLSVMGLIAVGCPRLNIPGITPRVLKMIEEKKVTVLHIRTGLPFLNVSEVTDNLGDWSLSLEDAAFVRQHLYTERQKQNLALKKKEGRYTLEEAADRIEQALFFPVEDEDEDEIDSEINILNELSEAAFAGDLPVYFPGKREPFKYSDLPYGEVRIYYEELSCVDLNRYLERRYPQLKFRFDCPGEKKIEGVTKEEILSREADWQQAIIGLKLEGALSAPPNWIKPAWVQRGRPGGGRNGSHRWNPAMLAICLMDRKQLKAKEHLLTKLLNDHFPKYLDQWTAYLEDYSGD